MDKTEFKRSDVFKKLRNVINGLVNNENLDSDANDYQWIIEDMDLLINASGEVENLVSNYSLFNNFNENRKDEIDNIKADFKRFLKKYINEINDHFHKNSLKKSENLNKVIESYNDIDSFNFNKIRRLIKNYLSLIDEYANNIYKSKEFREIRSEFFMPKKFNEENFLYNFSNFPKEHDDIYSVLHVNKNIKKKVFLSYTFKDKLYAFGLFIVFLENNLLLYVDCVFQGRIKNTNILKDNIYMIISSCESLVFLRSNNSELGLRGNKTIKQWSAWEIGTFDAVHHKNSYYKKNQYYIKVLADAGKNAILDDFSILDDINKI